MENQVREVQERMGSASLSDRLKALKQPVLSSDALIEGAEQWKYCFLAKLYADKNLTVGELNKELKKLWIKSKEIFIKKEEPDYHMVKFYSQEEYELVLKFRSWFIEGDLFVMEPWNPKIPKSMIDLTKQLLWLRLYNMQPEFANPTIVKSIGSVMGEVRESHELNLNIIT